ncbi:MAG: hypothetical protein IPH93_17610 [Saprospiraceae bacterium]|nr:hypothetical protein [Saprospiraceae bacterium]MBK9632136.1 hypothetical protein [Saprospiraceae bacterium]
MKYQIYCFFWMSSILFSCKNDPKNSETMDVAPDPKDGVALSVNLFGDKLNEWPDPDSVVSMRQSVIETARTAYLGKLEEPKGYLVYGRAYLTNGNVENAIQIFGKGSAKFPQVPDFYVYSGEAMLLGRQLRSAIDQFWKAGQNMEKSTSAEGISGMTGRDSLAGMSLQFRNYLLMGLAFQASKDFSSADKMFEVCGDFSTNSDLWIRSYYWQYECYHRSGRTDDIKNILSNVTPGMQISKSSQAYLDAMLFYKGEKSESELVDINTMPTTSAEAEDWLIKAYAVGVKYLLAKNQEKATDVFKKMMSTKYWNQLPYLAAESELALIGGIEQIEPEVIELNTEDKKKPVKF